MRARQIGVGGLLKSAAKSDIVIYIPSFAGGGVERVFVRIANEMHRLGQLVRIVVNDRTGPMQNLVASDIPIISLDARRTRHALRPLVAFLRRERPGAVVSALTYNNFSVLIANRLASMPSRVIISERAQVSGVLTDYSFARRGVTRTMIRYLYSWAHAVTAVSRGTAEDLAKLSGMELARIQVIPNAPPEPELYAAARAAPSPHPWLDDGQSPTAVAVGRLEPQKDYPLMLQAVAETRRLGVPARLIVLGEGSLRTELEALATHLHLSDVVTFAGFAANALDYIVRADLFVMTSLWEGYPNALLEAAVAGIPVVSTECGGGGARDILGEGGICTSRTPNALAQAMVARLRSNEGAGTPPQVASLTISDVARLYIALAQGETAL